LNKKSRLAWQSRLVLGAILIAVLIIAGYAGYLYAHGNFHVITEGTAYRSAQPDRQQLGSYARDYGIKSVLNLRGANPDKQWYRDEISASSALGILHYDIALASTREPSPQDVAQLLYIFNTAPRPILIHCQFGADRTGAVAALWKYSVDKEPKPEAARQLSLFYGHIPFFGRQAMDRFFDRWQP